MCQQYWFANPSRAGYSFCIIFSSKKPYKWKYFIIYICRPPHKHFDIKIYMLFLIDAFRALLSYQKLAMICISRLQSLIILENRVFRNVLCIFHEWAGTTVVRSSCRYIWHFVLLDLLSAVVRGINWSGVDADSVGRIACTQQSVTFNW